MKRWDNTRDAHIFPTDTLYEWKDRPIDDAVVVMKRAWGGGTFKTSSRAAVNRWDKWTALEATSRLRSRPFDAWDLVLDDNFLVVYPKGQDFPPHVEPDSSRGVIVRYLRE